MSRQLAVASGELLHQAARICWELAKTMVPILILLRLLKPTGIVEHFGAALAPVMAVVGLPGSMGLVWASAMLTNLYGGMAAFAALAPAAGLTIAQATVLCTMMLVAHALPVEGRIAQRAGARARTTLLLRFGGALLFGWILHLIYSYGGLLQEPVTILWQERPSADDRWLPWVWTMLGYMATIFAIVLALLVMMRLLKRLGILDLLIRLLQPVLRTLGISSHAAPLALVGMLMGLTYGGGLIIDEARSGKMAGRDVVASLALMGLCHSLIEDTLLMIALGAHVSGVLWARLLLSLVLVSMLVRLIARLPDRRFNRIFFRPSRTPKVTDRPTGEPSSPEKACE